MKMNLENAFSEVMDMLNYIENEYKEKIPNDVLQMFEAECNKPYLEKLLADTTDMKEKIYSEEALAIIAYLNLKYWCKDSNEKTFYKNLYLN